MNMSCCSSASHLFERVSSPPPSYSTRRPEVRISGNSLGDAVLDGRFLDVETEFGSAEFPRVGSVGYFLTSSPRRVDRLAVDRHRIWQVPRDARALALPFGRAAVLIATRWMPPERSVDHATVSIVAADLLDDGEFLAAEVRVPAELLQDAPS